MQKKYPIFIKIKLYNSFESKLLSYLQHALKNLCTSPSLLAYTPIYRYK